MRCVIELADRLRKRFLRFALADQALDFVVFVVGEDADHGHHAHHASGPVGRKAVVSGLATAASMPISMKASCGKPGTLLAFSAMGE